MRHAWQHIGLVLLGLGSLAACGDAPSGEDTAGAAPPVEVGVLTLQAQAAQHHVTLPGRVVALRSAEVRPQVSGIVRRRLFEEGSQVQAGQVLFELDDASYQAAQAQAQAQLDKADARVASLSRTLKRSTELMALEGVSRQEHEEAEAALVQAEAERAAARAALRVAQVDLERTRLRAPIAGRIDRAGVSEGALVTQGQTTALATIVQLDPVWVDVVQPSQELLAWRQRAATPAPATPVRIRLEDGSQHPQLGELRLREASVDPAAGTVTLRARVPNPEHWLLPGMYVRAELALAQWSDALLLPAPALHTLADGRRVVWVVDAHNRAQERSVQVDALVQGRWRVREGLRAGERVVVEGTQRVSPGQAVKVRAWPAVAASAASATP
jgi:membrane fusion protein, multidrug efflux system